MPKLPTHDSERALIIQQPSFLRAGANEGKVFDIGAEGAAKAADLAAKWGKALDTIQTTTASANFKTGIADILNRAENDLDYNNSEQYVREIEDLRKQSLKGFSNKAAEQRTAFDFEYESQGANIKLQNIFKKKAIEAGQVSALRLIDLEKSNYINANEKGKIQSAATIKNIIDANVKAGVFGLKEGDTLYKSAIKEAEAVIKDKDDLLKKQRKEIQLAQQVAKNEREDELVQMRVNMADAEGNPLDPADLIDMVRTDMNSGSIDPKFAQVFINSLKSTKFAKPTTLESVVKYNELVDRNAAMKKKEDAWLGMGRVPFEDIANFRADVVGANAEGFITDKQMKDLLSDTSKTISRDPVFRDALKQLGAHSSLYATDEAQARIKAQMYGSLYEKVIAGKSPREAVSEVITEKIQEEIGNVSNKDEFGFELGEERNGHIYIGNDRWQKKQ